MSIIDLTSVSPRTFDPLIPFKKKTTILSLNHSIASIAMWRNVASQALLKSQWKSLNFPSFPKTYSFLSASQEPIFLDKFKFFSLDNSNTQLGFHRIGGISTHEDCVGKPSFGFLRNSDSSGGNLCCGFCRRGYASVAEAVSSTDVEDNVSVVDEMQKSLQEMRREEEKERDFIRRSEIRKEEEKERDLKRRIGMGSAKYVNLRRRQVKIEVEAWEQAAKEYEELLVDMCQHKLAPNLPYMKSLFLGWFEPLRDAIEKEQELIGIGKIRPTYAPYFDELSAEKMAVITMHKLTGLVMTGGYAKVLAAACTIGDAIEQEIRIQKFLNKTKKKEEKDGDCQNSEEGESPCVMKEQEMLRKKVTDLIKKQKLPAVRKIVKGRDLKPWSTEDKAKVGSRLIELLLQTAYIQPPDQSTDSPPDIRPAFVHTFRRAAHGNNKPSKTGVIQCDPLIFKGLERTARHMVIPYMPMLVPPLRWKGYDKGAHFFLPSYIMRIHGAKQQREAIQNAPREQLKQVFEALDTLGNTKWRVNKRVLNVVERIWNSGGCLADLVDRSDVPLPEKPETEDVALLNNWKWKLRSVKKLNSERHSQRCDVELKLAVARKMKDEEAFYYPHNLDFRGRAYPMHPYLNHLGSDLCRGILEFAEGRPLGKSGLRWLKIHLANLYANGVDKLSYDGRIAFTENHLNDIFDSAEKPLEGKRWWLQAEDPFQCLAVCINLTEALRSSSPETIISHIPIHQDGSCNGLQHYAALGRDKLGATAVNLVAGEKPADVYSGIAERVLDIMLVDIKKDPEVHPDALHAKVLINQVNRKLVKQTVMTSVYGVTYIGARDQIKRRLKERGLTEDSDIFGASCYAAKVTLTALGEMFEAARSIMNWLGECAKIIASEDEPVRWTTPIRLPVVQPYRKLGKRTIRTSLQILTIQKDTEKVMVKRQRTAFPPNFIHSLDGSHMMKTAGACKRAGLNFAGVHDSYWTHACDVDEMNKILREKFVELYEEPILENLLESFQTSFPTLSFPPLPERGDFNLRELLESPYFFN